MPAPGSAKAVSDYEHLSQSCKLNSKGLFQGYNSEELDDALPLKPSKHLNKDKAASSSVQREVPGHQQHGANFNFNNAASLIRARDSIGLTQMLGDFGHLHQSRVPIPTAWSPGVKGITNPDLFVTPEKEQQTSKQVSAKGKENVSESQTIASVPTPAAWSPGMVIKPNPALLVTPDKDIEHKLDAIARSNYLSTRGKEKHTVRFDLPSVSSGEDTLSVSQDIYQSPITVTAHDLVDDTLELSNPQKAYDPNAYSEDSVLDHSVQSQISDNHPESKNSSEVEGGQTTSDRLADKLQELLLSSMMGTDKPEILSSLIPSQSVGAGQLAINSKRSPAPEVTKASRQVMSAVDIPRHPSPKSKRKIALGKKESKKEATASAGPEFLRAAPVSQYEPQPAGTPAAHIVRESGDKSQLENSSYAFPFDSAAGSLDNENVFARPEYNSTLRVGRELDELCHREVDVDKAVATTLIKSEDKRTELNEKASVYTNRLSKQFKNLVDLEPAVDSLCSKVVTMRTNKAKAKKQPRDPVKASKAGHTPPDLMEFLPADLQKETPDFSLPGIKPVTSELHAASHDLAFDLYRHNRLWQGINDF